MKTIAIAMQKGGVGKSTLTRSLAVAASKAGLNVLTLDMDAQQSTTQWAERRAETLPLVRFVTEIELPKVLKQAAEAGCDLIIIDTPPARSTEAPAAVEYADLVLVPCTPDIEAYEQLARTERLARTTGKPAAEHPDEYWDKVIEINQTAQFIITREFGRDMIARGYGKIIFTASLLTFQGGINVPGYAASKAAVGELTMAFANEWASKGVNVNAVAPGYIATDNTQALREDPVRSQQILGRIPAGRWGTPEDFMGPVVFLASDASAYMHGTIVLVDGGWMGR